ncbi:unnamed protein product [Allacma fusca]|uniref:Uncharacterized protein n=1 Tax=Allacma fusca TaxID=39272 RepID=A0A8J2P877_9HEXA|nr:unnamed protein product [Allacma fusca]
MDIGTVTPLPGHPEGLCNHWISFLTEYPCQSDTSVERLYRTETVIKKNESSPFCLAFTYSLRLATKLPVKIVRTLLVCTYARAPSLALTSFPTSTSREFVDGMEVVDAYASACVTTGIGMEVTSWGVNNRQRTTFWACENILKSPVAPGTLSNFYMEDIEELYGHAILTVKKDS